jgi:hypothetical protein
MRKSLRIVVRVMLVGGVGMIASQANAQLKVGKNPTTIEKSAILDLDADKQGLLLPRLTDTVGITGLTPPDGMVIYLKKAGEEGFYVRNHGYWQRMANAGDVANTWGLRGNPGTAGDFIGTTTNVPFSLKANNVESFVIDNGYAFLKKLDLVTSGVEVLLIDPVSGKINKRTISETAFTTAINKINGLTAADQKLTTAAPVATPNDYVFSTTGTDTHVLTIATQKGLTGAGEVTAGLLSLADYKRFDKATLAMIIGAFDATPVNDGLTIDNTNPAVAPKLILHAADATHPGAVSTGAQSFDGLKTFLQSVTGNEDLTILKKGQFGTGLTVLANGATITGNSTITGNLTLPGATSNLAVGGNSTLTGTLAVTGATTLASTLGVTGKATLDNDLQVKGNTQLDNNVVLTNIADGTTQDVVLLRDGTSGNVVKRKLSATAFKDLTFKSSHAGLDLAVAQVADEVTVSIPVASPATTGGLVSNAAQSFAGAKKFGDEVSIKKNVHIGDTNNIGNSTLQVTGSVSMSITTITAGGTYTVSATDNTILVSANAVSSVVLPDATTCTGRIYTVKKIPAASAPDDTKIDNDVQITSAGGTLEGGAKLTIYNDWTFYTVQSNGTNWYVIKK